MKDKIDVGRAYRVYYNENNPNNRTFHVRAIVDTWRVVVAVWSKRKQWWYYSVENLPYLNDEIRRGVIKPSPAKFPTNAERS